MATRLTVKGHGDPQSIGRKVLCRCVRSSHAPIEAPLENAAMLFRHVAMVTKSSRASNTPSISFGSNFTKRTVTAFNQLL